MKIAFVGVGNVGSALANHLSNLGHEVVLAAHDMRSATLQKALGKNPQLKAAPLEAAVASAEVIFLATPFDANESALKSTGPLKGKVLVDCTNPVAPDLSHGLANKQSGGEYVQSLAPQARVVKAFTIYGYENFDHAPSSCGGNSRPAMPIAGNDSAAKQTVSALCREMGWEPIDVGDIAMSLHLEHMTILWIKMVRVSKRYDNFLWCAMHS